MKRVLTAAVLIPLVLVVVFLGPRWQWLFTLVTAVVAALASWEYLTLARLKGAEAPRLAVAIAILALFAATFQWPDQVASILGILSLTLLLVCTFSSPIARVLPDATNAVFCLIYTGFTLISLPALHAQHNGPSLVVFLLCVVWAGDIAALYIGRPFGRHKLAPTLSPNKTWEGSIASVAGSLLAAGGLLGISEYLAGWNSVALSYADEIWWYWLVLGGHREHRRPGGRPGRVCAQAFRRRQRFWNPAARPRGYPRPYRRPAAGRSGAMVRSTYPPAVLEFETTQLFLRH